MHATTRRHPNRFRAVVLGALLALNALAADKQLRIGTLGRPPAPVPVLYGRTCLTSICRRLRKPAREPSCRMCCTPPRPSCETAPTRASRYSAIDAVTA